MEILARRRGPDAVIPIFPLNKPPFCVHCQWTGQRRTTHDSNANGNAGRPYWICTDDSCPQWVHEHRDWICWDDNRGLAWDNPPCKCGYGLQSRMETMGHQSKRPGNCFWSCALGLCAYYSEDVMGLTWEQLDDCGIAVRRFGDIRWPFARGERVLGPASSLVLPDRLVDVKL